MDSSAASSDSSNTMALLQSLSKFDMIALSFLGFGAVWYIFYKLRKPKQPKNSIYTVPQSKTALPGTTAPLDTSLVGKLKQSGKSLVVLYGSQTGTAEGFANSLVKEAARYGIRGLVVDLEEVQLEDLERVGGEIDDCVALFCMATYGEGDPTDNAQEFIKALRDADTNSSNLSRLRYAVFALGNKTYEHYNAIGKQVDKRLVELGAQRVHVLGLGDDDANIEEDFMNWKEGLWPALCTVLGRSGVQLDVNLRQYRLKFYEPNALAPERVFSGEAARLGSYGNQRVPFDAKNPFLAKMLEFRELHKGGDRSCMHVELDLTGSKVRYEAGDHLAVCAANPPELVERLGAMLLPGLYNTPVEAESAAAAAAPDSSSGAGAGAKPNVPRVAWPVTLDAVLALENVEEMSSKRHPFPCPCTFRTALTFYVDLSAPPRASLLSDLAEFATDPEHRARLKLLASHEGHEQYTSYILKEYRNVVDVLADFPSCRPPLDLLCELLPRLQVRYYSISSSPKAYASSVHITAVLVRNDELPAGRVFVGVATGWLSRKRAAYNARHKALGDGVAPVSNGVLHGVNGVAAVSYAKLSPEERELYVPVFVRRSQFKLPYKSTTPIVMIGPGTGIAPFRGFIQERHQARQEKKPVGETVLYFGCRNAAVDYIYGDELEMYKNAGTLTSLYVAFSRDQHEKVYVQHMLLRDENRQQLWRLLDVEGAHLYVCGDGGKMARDVLAAVEKIVMTEGGRDEAAAREYVKRLRQKGRYSEDVWS